MTTMGEQGTSTDQFEGTQQEQNTVEQSGLKRWTQNLPGSAEVRERILNRGGSIIRSDPWRAVIAAFALGLLFGRRSRPKMEMWRGDIDMAFHRSQAFLVGALWALFGRGRRVFRSTLSSAGDTLHDVRGFSKPLKKAVRRAGRKMHLTRRASLMERLFLFR